MGRSKGGLTTKIHTRTDALGNPTGFYLTGGAAHDLCGSDELLDVSISQTWLADKAYDADARVIEPIKAVQGNAVIPSKCHRLQPRDFDKELYKARHLIENFFAKIKQYRAIA
ncbi:transposase, partial [Psychrobacter sp. FME5]|nr:transposase [Psychrobacter sp. FME5]